MKIYILFIAIALTALFTSCGSDEPETESVITIEDVSVARQRQFAERYGLSKESVLELRSFSGIGSDNIGAYSGCKDGNVAIFICDTLANKALYSNFNALSFQSKEEFLFPYGEKKQFDFSTFGLTSLAKNPDLIAFSGYAVFGEAGTPNSACKYFQFLYFKCNLKCVERPHDVKRIYYDLDKVINWFDNSVLFYRNANKDYPNENKVVCFDKNGERKFDAPYPYFDEDHKVYDLFNADIIQPLTMNTAIGIKESGGSITAFLTDVPNHKKIWANSVHIDNYKKRDIIEFENASFNNNIIEFYINITSFNGDKRRLLCKVDTNGNILVN